MMDGKEITLLIDDIKAKLAELNHEQEADLISKAQYLFMMGEFEEIKKYIFNSKFFKVTIEGEKIESIKLLDNSFGAPILVDAIFIFLFNQDGFLKSLEQEIFTGSEEELGCLYTIKAFTHLFKGEWILAGINFNLADKSCLEESTLYDKNNMPYSGFNTRIEPYLYYSENRILQNFRTETDAHLLSSNLFQQMGAVMGVKGMSKINFYSGKQEYYWTEATTHIKQNIKVGDSYEMVHNIMAKNPQYLFDKIADEKSGFCINPWAFFFAPCMDKELFIAFDKNLIKMAHESDLLWEEEQKEEMREIDFENGLLNYHIATFRDDGSDID